MKFSPLSKSKFKSMLHNHSCTMRNEKYQENDKGTCYKALFPSIFTSPPLSVCRNYETILFCLCFGHWRLRALNLNPNMKMKFSNYEQGPEEFGKIIYRHQCNSASTVFFLFRCYGERGLYLARQKCRLAD